MFSLPWRSLKAPSRKENGGQISLHLWNSPRLNAQFRDINVFLLCYNKPYRNL